MLVLAALLSTVVKSSITAGFEDVSAHRNASVCDAVFNCTHAIRRPDGIINEQDWRVVSSDSLETSASSSNHDDGTHPGFRTYYANTLGVASAEDAGSIHNCSGSAGAQIGVVSKTSLPRMKNVPEGANAYQFKASGVDGLIMMCFSPVLLRQPPAESNGGLYAYTAKVDAYLAQAGWHEEGDALRVWAETTVNGGDQPGRRAVSMLPGCAHVATKHTVDMLMLRAQTATPGQPYSYTGPPNGDGDPAILPDTWKWQTLSLDLSADVRSVGVCAGLQTGAGAEEFFVDNLRIERTDGPPYHPKVCEGVELAEWPWPPKDSFCPGEYEYGLLHPRPDGPPGSSSNGDGDGAASNKKWSKQAVAAAIIFPLFIGIMAAGMLVIKFQQVQTRRRAGGANTVYAAHINVMSTEAEA